MHVAKYKPPANFLQAVYIYIYIYIYICDPDQQKRDL